MAVRLSALLPRFVVLTLLWLFASATLTFAADKQLNTPARAKIAPVKQAILVVPDVRDQAFVFAKGILEDGGFAWRVAGGVHGYATNTVVSQSPAPGTRVVDTGAPTIAVTLARGKYPQQGVAEDTSPYAGTPTRLSTDLIAPAKKPAPGKLPLAPPKLRHSRTRIATPKKPAVPTAHRPKAKRAAAPAPSRPPAFHVPNAPREPLDEMPLPARAQKLERWIETSPRPTNRTVRHWLYQHQWIVTGAKFGWWHGAQALQILIRVDRLVKARWGIGNRSEAVARAALATVRARTR
jgi:hypothetical protein